MPTSKIAAPVQRASLSPLQVAALPPPAGFRSGPPHRRWPRSPLSRPLQSVPPCLPPACSPGSQQKWAPLAAVSSPPCSLRRCPCRHRPRTCTPGHWSSDPRRSQVRLVEQATSATSAFVSSGARPPARRLPSKAGGVIGRIVVAFRGGAGPRCFLWWLSKTAIICRAACFLVSIPPMASANKPAKPMSSSSSVQSIR